jgi:DNA mismatch repair ATPase MutL
MEVNEAIKKDIDDILEGFQAPAPAEEVKEEPLEEKAEEKVEETPIEKAEEQPAEKKEEKSEQKGQERAEEEAGEQSAEASEQRKEEGEVAAPDPLAEKEKEIAELRMQLQQFAEKVTAPAPVKEKTPEETAAEVEAAKKVVLPFIQNEEIFDEVFKNHQNFNALLTAVVNTAREQALRALPQVAMRLVDQQLTLKMAAQEFFSHNEDLLPYRQFLGTVANEIESQHPDYTVQQIFEETEKEGRKRLRLVRTQGAPGATITEDRGGNPPEKKPGFVPGSPGGRRSAHSPLTGQDKEIADLIED